MPLRLAIVNVAGFYAAQVAVTGYAIVRGGAPERLAGVALLMAAIGSTAYQHLVFISFDRMAGALLAIDIALLMVLMTIAAFADRFWPLWLAAFQFLAIGNHAVRAYDPSILNYAYWLLAGKLSYPMLMTLLIGTVRHRRRGKVGWEWAWSFQRRRST